VTQKSKNEFAGGYSQKVPKVELSETFSRKDYRVVRIWSSKIKIKLIFLFYLYFVLTSRETMLVVAMAS
jgi:hypothetical protein